MYIKRPIVIATIGYIIGIIWGLYLKKSIILLIFMMLFIYMLVYIAKRYKKHKIINKFIDVKTVIIITMFAITANFIVVNKNLKYNNLYREIENIKISCTVISNKNEKEYKNEYIIKVANINRENKFKNTYLILNTNKEINLNYGDFIIFDGKYEEPIGQRNYKGFNYKEYLKTLEIYGIVKLENNLKILKQDNLNIIEREIFKIREKVKENIKECFSTDSQNFLIALLVGDKDNLSEEITENFKITNLSHILAISGAHVNYIIIGIIFIIRKIKISKRTGNIISIIFFIFFMFFTGSSISVIRACISIIILISSKIIYKQNDIWSTVSLSLFIILIKNPFNINNLSVLLSFGGTIGLITFYNYLYKERFKNKILNYIESIIAISLSAQIIIFPIMLIKFGTISLAFILSNLIASPFLGILVIIGYLIIIISLISIKTAFVISIIIEIILKIFIQLVKLCSNIPGMRIYSIIPSIKIVYIYYLLIIQIYIFYIGSQIRKNKIKKCIRKYLKKIIIIIIIIILVNLIILIIPKNLEIFFIDVGQR